MRLLILNATAAVLTFALVLTAASSAQALPASKQFNCRTDASTFYFTQKETGRFSNAFFSFGGVFDSNYQKFVRNSSGGWLISKAKIGGRFDNEPLFALVRVSTEVSGGQAGRVTVDVLDNGVMVHLVYTCEPI